MAEPYKNFQLTLKSRDAFNAQGQFGGVSRFNIQTLDMSSVVAFRVKSFCAENSFYNVTAQATDGGRNLFMSLTYSGNVTGSHTFSITAGNYTISELLAAIVAGFATFSHTVTATFSNPTQLITITFTPSGGDATISLTATGSVSWNRLGFLTTTALGTSFVGSRPYELNFTQFARLLCPTLASGANMVSLPNTGITRNPCIAVLEVGSRNGWEFVWTDIPGEWWQTPNITNISTLDFQLEDDAGFDLILNRAYWSVVLEFRTKL